MNSIPRCLASVYLRHRTWWFKANDAVLVLQYRPAPPNRGLTMAIPKVEEVSLPVLQELGQGSLTTDELTIAMVKKFPQISEEERREAHANGVNKLRNNIQFAVGQRMGDAGLVRNLSPKSAKPRYEVTTAGHDVLLAPPPLITHRWLCDNFPKYNDKYGRRQK
jgi:hypothetical protein